MVPILLILATTLLAVDQPTDLELYTFGASYHSNRTVNWNENNLGLGLGVAIHTDTKIDIIFAGGGYKDSYNEIASFGMFGARYVMGERKRVHATAGFMAGYYNGSGFAGVGMIPVVSIGYNWVDLCFTGSPPESGHKHNNSDDPKQNRETESGMVAAFLKIRLCTF